MGGKGQHLFAKLINIQRIKQENNVSNHHSNNCCRQDPQIILILEGKSLRRKYFHSLKRYSLIYFWIAGGNKITYWRNVFDNVELNYFFPFVIDR